MSCRTTVRSWSAAIVVVAATFAVEPAGAEAGWLDVLRDCSANGGITGGTYTRGELEQALERLPADLDEYSECGRYLAAALRDMDRYGRKPGVRAADSRGSGTARSVAGHEGGGPRRDGSTARGEPDQSVAGALLSGAESVGTAPLDAVEAAAEGRLGLPGWGWPLLIVAGLLGIGVARERRA